MRRGGGDDEARRRGGRHPGGDTEDAPVGGVQPEHARHLARVERVPKARAEECRLRLAESCELSAPFEDEHGLRGYLMRVAIGHAEQRWAAVCCGEQWQPAASKRRRDRLASSGTQ